MRPTAPATPDLHHLPPKQLQLAPPTLKDPPLQAGARPNTLPLWHPHHTSQAQRRAPPDPRPFSSKPRSAARAWPSRLNCILNACSEAAAGGHREACVPSIRFRLKPRHMAHPVPGTLALPPAGPPFLTFLPPPRCSLLLPEPQMRSLPYLSLPLCRKSTYLPRQCHTLHAQHGTQFQMILSE